MYSRKSIGPRIEPQGTVLKNLKKTSIPSPIKNLGHIKCYNLSSPDLLKDLEIITARRSAADQ